MKQEAKKWYYYLFDEVTGALYESGEWYTTRSDAFERIQELHYFILDELKKAGKRTKADQLRSIIKNTRKDAVREYMRMTGKEVEHENETLYADR